MDNVLDMLAISYANSMNDVGWLVFRASDGELNVSIGGPCYEVTNSLLPTPRSQVWTNGDLSHKTIFASG